MTSLRLPSINAPDTAGQVSQIRSYLFQIYEHLQYAERAVGERTAVPYVSQAYGGKAGGASSVTDGVEAASFAKMKALIISSADIVNAYYETICRRLRGVYVAESAFGEFQRTTLADYQANAEALSARFEEIESIVTKDGEKTVYLSSHIRAGLLDEGVSGIEVGQTTYDEENQRSFRRFARFTPDELSFYDENEEKVAWISGYVLHILSAEIMGNLRLGGYKYDTSDGIIHQWVGEG